MTYIKENLSLYTCHCGICRQLKSSLSYLDESKFAIWGWVRMRYCCSDKDICEIMFYVVIWRVLDIYGGW